MKGIVFNLLEEVVCAHHGEAAWDDLLEGAQLQGSYTSLGSYPDADMGQLLQSASKTLNSSPNEVLRWFGREAMPLLARRYPAFFAPHKSVRPFVLSLNSIIHAEVHKLYPGAHCPHFNFTQTSDSELLIGYRSARRLCALAEGFIHGAALYFNDPVALEHVQCMHRGDEQCLMRMTA